MDHRPLHPDALDPSQRHVVELPAEASALVIGAAGTGKTTAILARVALLLSEGPLAPEDVLILTPTRQSATSLRDRAAAHLDVATPGALARSVASLAFQIVRAGAVAAGEPLPQLLTAPDQDALIGDLLEGDETDAADGLSRWPDSVPAPVRRSRAFRSELRALFALAAELGLSASDLERLGRERGREVWQAAASLWTEYRYALSHLRPAHRDPSELLDEAARLIADGPVTGLPRVLLIDDAQELSPGAVALVAGARRRGIAVLAFGDPDVGSGAFRGAGPETFARLTTILTDHVVLRHQHRAGPELTRVSREVAASIGAAGTVAHRLPPGAGPAAAEASDDGRIRVDEIVTMRAASAFDELDGIAHALRSWHVLEAVPWRSLAVIAHDSRQVARLTTELAAREVPTRAVSATRPLAQEPAVRQLLQVVELAVAPHGEWAADEIASALTSPFGGLDAVGLRRLRGQLRAHEFAGETRRSAADLLAEAMTQPAVLVLLDTPQARAARRLGDTLRVVRERAADGASAHELLWTVWERSGLAAPWRERASAGGADGADANRSLDALVALFAAAKRAAERGDEDPQRFFSEVLGSEVPEDSLALPQHRDLVEVLTPAAALGREFDAVVIAGVQDGVWPNPRLRGGLLDGWRLSDEALAWRAGQRATELAVLDRRRGVLHEELRLFERALTRARSRVLVTAVDDEDQSPSVLFSYLPVPPPRRVDRHPLTLRGAVAKYRRRLTETVDPERAADAAAQLAVLAAAGVPGADPDSWYGIAPRTGAGGIHDLAREPVSVSPSRIETFEDCGLDWAIRELGGQSRSFSAGLGTILHAAMEAAPDGTFAQIDAIVDERWGELDFDADWLSRQERSWARTLSRRLAAYLREFRESGGQVVGAESRFRLAIVQTPADPVPRVLALSDGQEQAAPEGTIAVVNGSIDRVERWPSPDVESPGVESPGVESPGVESPRGGRLAVVDLKTGRSERRVSDDKVADDAQLSAYQLAVQSGAVDSAGQVEMLGARLLVLSKTRKNSDYRIAHQPPLTDSDRELFLTRIAADARGMAAESFIAHPDTHCNDDHFALCRLHTVKPVSAP